jgi:hypothetical protein
MHVLLPSIAPADDDDEDEVQDADDEYDENMPDLPPLSPHSSPLPTPVPLCLSSADASKASLGKSTSSNSA